MCPNTDGKGTMKMKKRLISLGLILTMLMTAAVLSSCGKTSAYTPTFMYFVSGSDADFEAETAVFEKLQKEYDGKVKFDLHNIDETPEDKDNFPVEGMTPALIMLNTSNDISAMEFQCSDEATLKEHIETALNGTGE